MIRILTTIISKQRDVHLEYAALIFDLHQAAVLPHKLKTYIYDYYSKVFCTTGVGTLAVLTIQDKCSTFNYISIRYTL
jgi:hypothetical protein